MFHIIEHTLLDSIKLVPFLFLTYLVMEFMEHKTGTQTGNIVKRAGKWGPLAGAIAGAVPQCGFSAAASNLYAGKVVSLGTLMAIYLSTSDEMLPILLSEKVELGLILKILGLKIFIGVLAGFAIDFLYRANEQDHDHIHEMCEQEQCHCENGIWLSALIHTLKISGFIILVTFLLNLILHNGGEDYLADILMNKPVVGPLIAGLVGMIPNCASSVVLTRLYIEGTMSFAAMMAGLLVGAGVGLLVLFRVNHNRKENLRIISMLYGIGVAVGIILQMIG